MAAIPVGRLIAGGASKWRANSHSQAAEAWLATGVGPPARTAAAMSACGSMHAGANAYTPW